MGASYGRYEVIRRLAAGGMATVHLGRTQGPGGFERLVAIKVMHEHIAEDPAFRDMFLDEARLCARIRHPNVVATLDVAAEGDFIVMEYIEGLALDAWLRIKRPGLLPLGTALRVALDVLDGLHAAHQLADADGTPLRLVHRDVSPQNVLVGVDGICRVGDFGIAYAASRLNSTRGSQLKGKIPYMAPEQLEDASVDRRADVYAAGCVLWEMLTGKRLFGGSSEAATACAVLAGPQQRPSQLADVPDSIDAACMQALMPRDERFDSALAFAQALEHAAEAAGIKLTPARKLGSEIAKDMAATSRPGTEPSHLVEPSSASEGVRLVEQLGGTQTAPLTPAVAKKTQAPSPDAATGNENHAPAAQVDRDELHTDTNVVTPAGVPSRGDRRTAMVGAAIAAIAIGTATAWALLPRGGSDSQPASSPTAAVSASAMKDTPTSSTAAGARASGATVSVPPTAAASTAPAEAAVPAEAEGHASTSLRSVPPTLHPTRRPTRRPSRRPSQPPEQPTTALHSATAQPRDKLSPAPWPRLQQQPTATSSPRPPAGDYHPELP